MNSDVTFQAEDPKKAGKKAIYCYKPHGPSIEVSAINLLNGVDD